MGAPSVVLVSRSFAAQVFPGQNAVGRRLNICWPIPNPVEIVGIAAEIRQTAPEDRPRPTVYLANLQAPMFFASLVVRAKSDPVALTPAVLEAIHRVNPDQAVSNVRTMDEVFSRAVSRPRLQSLLLGTFAAIGLLLAAIGVYGVAAYSVTQRTREIGIRMVLGASRRGVAGMILREGLLVAGAGLCIGLAGAASLSGVVGKLLYDVAPGDPATLVSVSALLVAAVILAMLVPARRATRIAPIVALREE